MKVSQVPGSNRDGRSRLRKVRRGVGPGYPQVVVLVGATGDLSRRKIMPGLFRRFVAGQMPPGARVIGSARSEMTADGFRADIRAAIAEHDGPRADHPQLDEFLMPSEAHLRVAEMRALGWSERDLFGA